MKKNVTHSAKRRDISNFTRSADLLGRLIGPPTAARLTRAFFCTFVTAVLLYAKHLGDILSWIITHPALHDAFYKSMSCFTTSTSCSTESSSASRKLNVSAIATPTPHFWPIVQQLAETSPEKSSVWRTSCGNSQTSQKMEKLIFLLQPGSDNRACKSLNSSLYYYSTLYYLQQFIFHCSVNRKWNNSCQHSNYETFSHLSEVLKLLPNCCLCFLLVANTLQAL